jgi:hypothetical protein
MLHNNYEVRVLVKGRPINEYAHEGKLFVEGRDGSNFEIEFINRTNARVEAIISVDGLSVIDGKDAGPQSSGYLVEPFGSIRIPGWKLNEEQVAAFVFAGKKKSYAQQSTGSARNTGVIGAMVFAEKSTYRPPVYHTYGGVMRGMSPTIAGGHINSGGWVPTGSSGDPIIGATLSGAALNNQIQCSYNSAGVVASAASAPRSKSVKLGAAPESTYTMDSFVEQTLGTGFGEATEFETTTVSFNRGEMTAMMVIYYDDSRGLRARGIELSRPSRQRYARNEAPQAFPGMNTGCTPPPGWKG